MDSSMGRAGTCWPATRRRFEPVSNLNDPCTGRQVRIIGFDSCPSGGGLRTAWLGSAVVSAGTMSGARSGRDPRSAVRIRPQPRVPPSGGAWQAVTVTTSRGHGISSERPGRTAEAANAVAEWLSRGGGVAPGRASGIQSVGTPNGHDSGFESPTACVANQGKCPVCERDNIDVRAGKLDVHYVWTRTGKRELVKCAGSGRGPAK